MLMDFDASRGKPDLKLENWSEGASKLFPSTMRIFKNKNFLNLFSSKNVEERHQTNHKSCEHKHIIFPSPDRRDSLTLIELRRASTQNFDGLKVDTLKTLPMTSSVDVSKCYDRLSQDAR